MIQVRFHAKDSGGREGRFVGDSRELWPGHENKRGIIHVVGMCLLAVTHITYKSKFREAFMTSIGKWGEKTELLEHWTDLRTSMSICYQGQLNQRSLNPMAKAMPKTSGTWARSQATQWLGLIVLSQVYPAYKNSCNFIENFNSSHPDNASILLYVQTWNFIKCCLLGLLPY